MQDLRQSALVLVRTLGMMTVRMMMTNQKAKAKRSERKDKTQVRVVSTIVRIMGFLFGSLLEHDC